MATNSNSRAVKIAQVHFEDDFSSRWGVEELMAEDAFYIFNNMPYRKLLTARDHQRDEIRRQLAMLGLIELGYGEWPQRGEEEGYSWVLIFDGKDRTDLNSIRALCLEIFSSDIGWEESD
jgi:hypothetical protein